MGPTEAKRQPVQRAEWASVFPAAHFIAACEHQELPSDCGRVSIGGWALHRVEKTRTKCTSEHVIRASHSPASVL